MSATNLIASKPTPAVSRKLASQAREDTSPELGLRSELHRRGLRFRLHRHVVPGAPRRAVDIVFGPARVAVAVHGCFWHGCPRHARLPEGATRAWWQEKLRINTDRDEDTRRRLEEAGWLVVEVWECEAPLEAATRVETAVRTRRQARE